MGQPARTGSADDGRQAFDFFVGSWRQTDRKRVGAPLVEGDTEWVEFASHTEAVPILGGLGNVDTFDAPEFPGRPGFKGFSLRLFEPETGLWRIWWASTIGNGHLDPPVVGRFSNGIGLFECDDLVDGVPVEGALRLVGHHRRLRHLGAVVLLRRWCDLGCQLDDASHADRDPGRARRRRTRPESRLTPTVRRGDTRPRE